MRISKYTKVQPAKFKPLSADEIMKVPLLKQSIEDKQIKDLEATRKAMLNAEVAPQDKERVIAEQKRLEDKMNSIATNIEKNGIGYRTTEDINSYIQDYDKSTSKAGILGGAQEWNAKRIKERDLARKFAMQRNYDMSKFDEMANKWDADQTYFNDEHKDYNGLYLPEDIDPVKIFNRFAEKAGMTAGTNRNGTISWSGNKDQLAAAKKMVKDAFANNEEYKRLKRLSGLTDEQIDQAIDGRAKVLEKTSHKYRYIPPKTPHVSAKELEALKAWHTPTVSHTPNTMWPEEYTFSKREQLLHANDPRYKNIFKEKWDEFTRPPKNGFPAGKGYVYKKEYDNIEEDFKKDVTKAINENPGGILSKDGLQVFDSEEAAAQAATAEENRLLQDMTQSGQPTTSKKYKVRVVDVSTDKDHPKFVAIKEAGLDSAKLEKAEILERKFEEYASENAHREKVGAVITNSTGYTDTDKKIKAYYGNALQLLKNTGSYDINHVNYTKIRQEKDGKVLSDTKNDDGVSGETGLATKAQYEDLLKTVKASDIMNIKILPASENFPAGLVYTISKDGYTYDIEINKSEAAKNISDSPFESVTESSLNFAADAQAIADHNARYRIYSGINAEYKGKPSDTSTRNFSRVANNINKITNRKVALTYEYNDNPNSPLYKTRLYSIKKDDGTSVTYGDIVNSLGMRSIAKEFLKQSAEGNRAKVQELKNRFPTELSELITEVKDMLELKNNKPITPQEATQYILDNSTDPLATRSKWAMVHIIGNNRNYGG